MTSQIERGTSNSSSVFSNVNQFQADNESARNSRHILFQWMGPSILGSGKKQDKKWLIVANCRNTFIDEDVATIDDVDVDIKVTPFYYFCLFTLKKILKLWFFFRICNYYASTEIMQKGLLWIADSNYDKNTKRNKVQKEQDIFYKEKNNTA